MTLPSPSIWQLGSLSSGDITAKVDIFNSSDPAVIGKNLLNSRFGALFLKIHHGTRIEQENLTLQWIKDFRKASNNKVQIAGWGVNEVDPIGECHLIHDLVGKYQLSAYIADAEGPHKQDWPGGDITRTNVFCTNFRKFLPTLPFGWSSFAASFFPFTLGLTSDVPGKPFHGPMDFGSPFRAKARWIPQVYPNESGPVYSMGVTIDHARRSGWPISLTHPWLGCWDSNHAYDPREYVAEMKAMKVVGFNVFRIEMMNQGDYDILNSEIKIGGIALPRT